MTKDPRSVHQSFRGSLAGVLLVRESYTSFSVVVILTGSFFSAMDLAVTCPNTCQFSCPRKWASAFNVESVGADSYFTLPQIRFRVLMLSVTPVCTEIFSLSRSKSCVAQSTLLPQPSFCSISCRQSAICAFSFCVIKAVNQTFRCMNKLEQSLDEVEPYRLRDLLKLWCRLYLKA